MRTLIQDRTTLLEPEVRKVPVDFGGELRRAREARGITLRQIATATKISLSALEALEKNDIARLPGGIFSRAFVRSFAIEVGLDPEQTVRNFIAHFPSDAVTAGSPYSAEPEPDTFESQRVMASTLVWLIIASVLVAGGIFFFSTRVRSASPASSQAKVAAPAAVPAMAPPSSSASAQATVDEPSQTPVKTGGTTGSAQNPAVDAEWLSIDIEARAPCWIALTVDGRRAFSRTLQAGEKQTERAHDEIALDIGDAGAFTYAINGVPGRSLGGPGEVVKARINRENLRTYLTRY